MVINTNEPRHSRAEWAHYLYYSARAARLAVGASHRAARECSRLAHHQCSRGRRRPRRHRAWRSRARRSHLGRCHAEIRHDGPRCACCRRAWGHRNRRSSAASPVTEDQRAARRILAMAEAMLAIRRRSRQSRTPSRQRRRRLCRPPRRRRRLAFGAAKYWTSKLHS